jgi:hypothetical protein
LRERALAIKGERPMPRRTEIVEKALGVKIPEQYAAFLEKYGIYDPPGIEVYGMRETLLRYDGIPCVIGATEIYRRTEDLPHRYLVIQTTGFEGEIICLDTEDGTVHSIGRYLGNHKVADCFDEWFERDILEYVRQRDKDIEEHGETKAEIIDLDWMRRLRHGE